MKKWFCFTALCLLFSFSPSESAKAQAGSDQKPAAALQDYVGRFEADPTVLENFIFDVFLDKGELWIKSSHAVKRKLAAKSAGTFAIADLDLPVKFSRDAKGAVESLALEGGPMSDGRKLIARKLVLPAANLKGNSTFRLKGYPGARVVALAGSFNEFKQSELLCGKEEDGWVCRVDLAPGKYTYKFVIDGDWILDPDNPSTEDDERGFTNSVVVVKGN